jgi:hypothetical protein
MSNHTSKYLFFAVLLASIAPASASIINVTNNSQVTLDTNEDLLFYISSANFFSSNGYTYPGEIEMLLGGMPLGGPVASIPGTSGVYMAGILFNGTLESQDGSVSIPLTDANARHVGLPGGDMLLTPGSRSGGSYSGSIDLLSALGTMGSQEAAELFASGEVAIDLHSVGAPVTFGYAGSSIASDFSASLFSQDGTHSMGARVLTVDCVTAPEPGTIGLLIIGLTIICTRLGKSHAARLAPCSQAREER